MLKKIFLVFILLVFISCQKESSEWNPVFEDTGFDYLYKEMERSLTIIDAAYSDADAEKENRESVQEKLHQVKNQLLAVKDYYVPLTIIRQKIYDAERFLKLKESKKAEKRLKESRQILKTIDLTTRNKVFDKVVLELESMIDEAMLSLNDASKAATINKMKTLGLHINLMLSRGDLVLSGIEFNQ